MERKQNKTKKIEDVNCDYKRVKFILLRKFYLKEKSKRLIQIIYLENFDFIFVL